MVAFQSSKLTVGVRIPYLAPLNIGIWCNGSTRDFDSLGLGSNPVIPANNSIVSTKPYQRVLHCTNSTLYHPYTGELRGSRV